MKKFDAIIALGGGINSSGRLSASSLTRTRMAVDLYRQEIADKIAVSGRWVSGTDHQPPHTEAAAMKSVAMEYGVPPNSVFTEEESINTVTNAYYLKKQIAIPYGFGRLAVVTCAAHVRRAELIFGHMFGPDYDIALYPTLERPDDQYVARERLGYIAVRALTVSIAPGDHEEFMNRYGQPRLTRSA